MEEEVTWVLDWRQTWTMTTRPLCSWWVSRSRSKAATRWRSPLVKSRVSIASTTWSVTSVDQWPTLTPWSTAQGAGGAEAASSPKRVKGMPRGRASTLTLLPPAPCSTCTPGGPPPSPSPGGRHGPPWCPAPARSSPGS